jgi:hypothetical protein
MSAVVNETKVDYITVTAPTPPIPGWAPAVYAATRTRGFYYTDDFGDMASGQPTWAPVNTGIPLTGGGIDASHFFLDPFQPARYQFCQLNRDNYVAGWDASVGGNELYRRTDGGSWTRILEILAFMTAKGITAHTPGFTGLFPHPLIEGWLGLFVRNFAVDAVPVGEGGDILFFYSTDRGDTWSSGVYVAYNRADHWSVDPGVRRIGVRAGSSSFAAGDVIYCPIRPVWEDGFVPSVDINIFVSTDRGATWSEADYTNSTTLVDLNDQDTVYVPGRVTKTIDRFATTASIQGDLPTSPAVPLPNGYEDSLLVWRNGASRAVKWAFFDNVVEPTNLWRTSNGGVNYTATVCTGLPDDGEEEIVYGSSLMQLEDAEDKVYAYSYYGFDDISTAGGLVYICDLAEGSAFVDKGGADHSPTTVNGIPRDCGGLTALWPFRV